MVQARLMEGHNQHTWGRRCQPQGFCPQTHLWSHTTGLLKGLNDIIPLQGCRSRGVRSVM